MQLSVEQKKLEGDYEAQPVAEQHSESSAYVQASYSRTYIYQVSI
jgi:hypothetical protein